MRKQNPLYDELFNMLIAVIESEEEPVHYRMLTSAIIDSQAFDLNAMYSRPSDSIYGMLIAGIRKGCTRYSFVGNGIFVSAGVLGGTEELIIDPPKLTESKIKKRKLPVLNRIEKCLDCEFFKMTDLQLASSANNYGSCVSQMNDDSYRLKESPICEFFKQKDYNTLDKEHQRKLIVQELVHKINSVVNKSVKGGNRSIYNYIED